MRPSLFVFEIMNALDANCEGVWQLSSLLFDHVVGFLSSFLTKRFTVSIWADVAVATGGLVPTRSTRPNQLVVVIAASPCGFSVRKLVNGAKPRPIRLTNFFGLGIFSHSGAKVVRSEIALRTRFRTSVVDLAIPPELSARRR